VLKAIELVCVSHAIEAIEYGGTNVDCHGSTRRITVAGSFYKYGGSDETEVVIGEWNTGASVTCLDRQPPIVHVTTKRK
jgi:hypothetical protein